MSGHLPQDAMATLPGYSDIRIAERSWDTDHFGVPIFDLLLPPDRPPDSVSDLAAIAAHQTGLPLGGRLWARVSAAQWGWIPLLQSAGFTVLDALVRLRLDLRHPALSAPPAQVVHAATVEDRKDLPLIAGDIFTDIPSHIMLDASLPLDKRAGVYRRWMESACLLGPQSGELFVGREGAGPVAFGGYRLVGDDGAEATLFGTARHARRKGWLSSLVSRVADDLGKLRRSWFEYGCHLANGGLVSGLARRGFVPQEFLFTLHGNPKPVENSSLQKLRETL